MKLGEALNERARLAKQVSELRDVLGASLVVQEGEEPPGNAVLLTQKAMWTIDEIESLVAAINTTNASTTLLDTETTLTQALAHRDALGAKIGHYEFIINKLARDDPYAYRRAASELKQERQVALQEIMDERDKLAKERRELEAQLQTVNWTHPLAERE